LLQPGAGKHIAGPRHASHHFRRHPAATKRRSKSDGSGRSSFDARSSRDDGKATDAVTRRGEASARSGVQNVTIGADENGMRVDRFLQARFPTLSFARIQRVIRKGEVRVNGKRVEARSRLEAGQNVRIPPLPLDPPPPPALAAPHPY